ncbi:MAG: 4Fe-4S dicluster-binding protein, partial [Haloarculaceae archaeon]
MTDGGDHADAPADAAPELAEDRADGPGDDGHTGPFPGVPEAPDAGDGRDAGVPPVTGGAPGRTPEGAKPIRFYRADAAAPREGEAGDCGCDSCGCGADGGGEEPVADGGATPANVDDRGSLGDLEFTPPATGESQDVDDGAPAERVNVPEGVELDTPGYSIRSRMNDIEEPDDKTWFMELDTAVIDAGRCIQCGTCVAACPSDSIGIGDDGLPELVKMCTGCSLCWDFCPRGGLRYERQWKITGGEDNVSGAGDPITEFSAKVTEDWREGAQDGGLVTSVLVHLLEAGEIDGALIAT